MPDISLDAMITEVRRELGYRRMVFPNSVATGKMTRAESDRRFDAMRAVLQFLEREREKQTGPRPVQDEMPLGSGHYVRGE